MEIILPQNCNQCPNSCPVDKLRCDKGRSYFERLRNGDATALPPSENELVKLLSACAKVAEHKSAKMREHGKNENEMFHSLSENEQTQLTDLLSKLQASWKAEHEQRHAQSSRS